MKNVKKLLFCAAIIFLTSCSSRAQFSETQWRNDLHYFKELVHTKYSNLFYNISAERFDSTVASIDKRLGSLDELQRKAEFVKLVAMFHVGHTAVRRADWTSVIPVLFYPFDDGLYIRSADARYSDAVGGKVTRIGNTSTEQVLQKIRPIVSYENEQGFKNMLQFYLNVPEYLSVTGIIDDPRQVSVSYMKDGKEKTILVPAESAGNMMHGMGMPAGWVDAYEAKNSPNSVLWLKQAGKLRYFEYLPDSKTVYVRHSAVQDEPEETIAAFFEKVFQFVDNNKVERFILDIRQNGGGNNYLNKPVITGLVQAKKINQKGKLFVIIGKATFSAAQNLTNEIEKYTEAIFVGEPSSENVNFYGDTRTEILPNSKLSIALSWLWWQNMDPRDKRPWTAPHLATDMQFADYKNGVDPAMNVIMNFKGQVPVDDQLRGLVLQGKYDEAVAIAKAYIADPVHRYFANELERKINGLGYQMMNQNKPEIANNIFQMNIRLFPESANAYDSYAESFWKMGKIDDAVKNYTMAISKDPNGATGESSRKSLEQINNKKGF
jgi:tetratricopeptide (TPR) repeat protein